jgi:UDP-N-acetylmuramyl pentapeptide phosphotransferase/UDP-N-acetylglucosamine-1-phosphate transferase
MYILIATFIVALIISWISIPSIIKVAQEKHLFDEPNERKTHLAKVPTLGGIAIFAGTIIALSLFLEEEQGVRWGVIFAAMVILFFTGVKDDLIPLSPYKKMLAQVLASALVVMGGGVHLSSFCGLLGIYELPVGLGFALSVFTLIVIINAFNLLDGINGLSGGIATIAALVFGIWFYQHGYNNMAVLGFATAGALVGFLRYNLLSGRIFMGDTGSLIVGFICAIMAIRFIELNKYSTFFEGGKAPVFAITVLILPLFDTFRVFVVRLLKGRSPFSGDRNHLHHALIDLGLKHAQASVLMYGIQLFFVALAWLLCRFNPYLALFVTLGLMLLLSQVPFWIKGNRKKQRLLQNKSLLINTPKAKVA